MTKIENSYNIRTITMKRDLHNLCTIGQDWFTAHVTVEMGIRAYIPDYIEVDKMFDEIEGKELIIEEIVKAVIEELKSYSPLYINVTIEVNDAKHLPVIVKGQYVER